MTESTTTNQEESMTETTADTAGTVTPTQLEEEQPPESDTEPEDDENDSDPGEPSDKAGKEAAKYRRQLREVEAERDSLATRLEVAQRAEVSRLLADGTGRFRYRPGGPSTEQETVRLAKPESLWLVTSMADLLDADGNVDSARVHEAVLAGIDAGLAVQPVLSIPTPLFGGSQPRMGGRQSEPKPALQAAMRPKR